MKNICRIIALIFLCHTSTSQHSNQSLNGIWKSIKQNYAGEEMSVDTNNKQTLTLTDSVFSLRTEKQELGAQNGTTIRVAYQLYTLNGTVKFLPFERMDIFGKMGTSKTTHITALYKLSNDTLTLCYDVSGKDYPKSFDAKNSPYIFLTVFVRKKSKE